MQLQLSTIAQILGCNRSFQDVMVTGTTIDSRQINPGDLFVAIKGEHVDGHDFIAAARQAGASAALVSSLQQDNLPQLIVDDVVNALGKIAHYWRQQCDTKIVAVTGSNGKTTVKEMLAAILTQDNAIIATIGNLNNELGVPLTLSRMSQDTEYAVIEMGTNKPGEIAYLANLVQPDIAIITNVGPAHLEGFHTVEAIAIEKGAIYSGLVDDGIGIINADMKFVDQWQTLLANKNVLTFALHHPADCVAKDIQLRPSSSHFMVSLNDVWHYVDLPLPGEHNVANALAAIAAANALNIPITAITKGLATMQSVPHRLQLRRGPNDAQLIDDTYNANPGSYQQALVTLTAFSGVHWVVLGDFGELGEQCDQIHQQLGSDAKKMGVRRMLTVGDKSQHASQAFGEDAIHFDNVDALKQWLLTHLTSDVVCLIKGSHFMRLDALADALTVTGEY